MTIDVVRKDASPAETVERIHGILDSLGFPRQRALVSWWNVGADCHSCHLRFAHYPLICSNGKGVTRELAYASALAEFMERLQCCADRLFTQAGNIHRLPSFFRSHTRLAREVGEEAAPLAQTDLRPLLVAPDVPLACLPFLDVVDGRLVALPFRALLAMTGTNGMCAGNTAEEAISHGICEVFERRVIRLLGDGALPGLPTVPLDALRIASPVLRRQLGFLRSAGLEVIVKDATLGGVLPVLGVVLIDRGTGTCQVSFGSDPDFDVALSRSLTEAFQGTGGLIRPLPPTGVTVHPPDLVNRTETLVPCLMSSVGTESLAGAFLRPRDNRECLSYLVERVNRLGHRLYVRDFSVFGFPAYYVYISGLSPAETLRVEAGESTPGALEAARRTVFRLAHAAPEEIGWCSRFLFGAFATPVPASERHFVQEFLRAPVAAMAGSRQLLSLMLLEAGELGKVRLLWNCPPAAPTAANPALSPDTLRLLIPAYRALRGARLPDTRVESNFAKAFGQAAPGCGEGGPIASSALPVPACESVYACPSCSCGKYCRLDEWFRIAGRLHERRIEVEQGRLIDVVCPGARGSPPA